MKTDIEEFFTVKNIQNGVIGGFKLLKKYPIQFFLF